MLRDYSFLDRLLISVDLGLNAILTHPTASRQIDYDGPDYAYSPSEREHVGALMRVNHTGEICAQGLYAGQALMANTYDTYHHLMTAAEEESDHLSWCYDQIKLCQDRISYLAPLWYAGSFTIGMIAASISDAYSLGFIVETENQVGAHLNRHLKRIPSEDVKTRRILEQMIVDEAGHATEALDRGAKRLPEPIKHGMHFCGKIMTTVSYYI